MCNYGDIYVAALPVRRKSSIQQGRRPVLVVSNDKNNLFSSVITVVPLTTKRKKHSMPTHVPLSGFGLAKPSVALCEQIITLDSYSLGVKIGSIDTDSMKSIKKAMMIQLNLDMCS